MDEEELVKLGMRVGEIATVIEDCYKESQDIEGAICGDDIYIVQTRPQI